MLYNLEALIIIGFSLYIVFLGISEYRKTRVWFDFLMVIIGILWTVLYVYVLFNPPKNSAWFGQTFIRPLNWLTLSFIIVLRKAVRCKQWKSLK